MADEAGCQRIWNTEYIVTSTEYTEHVVPFTEYTEYTEHTAFQIQEYQDLLPITMS